MGQARAKQYSLIKESGNDCMLGDKVMCVQLHGDAAFTGQGVIMEGLGLSMGPAQRLLVLSYTSLQVIYHITQVEVACT